MDELNEQARERIRNRRKYRNALRDILEMAADNFRYDPGNEVKIESLVSAMAGLLCHYAPYFADMAERMDYVEEIRGGD